jgi:type IV pilus assembly protein PilB
MTVTTGQEEVPRVLDQHTPLGVHLVASGLVTGPQVDNALEEQRRTGRRLGEILVGQGVLYEADLASTLAEMFELPYRDLSLDPPDPAAIGELPQVFCESHMVLPVGYEDGAVVIAVSDPRDMQTLDDLMMMTSKPVRLVVVASDQLHQAIETGFQALDLVVQEEEFAVGQGVDGQARASSIDAPPDVDISESEGPVMAFVNQLLRRAVIERASDLHLEPSQDGLRIRFRVDGLLHDVTSAPASLRAGIISRVKIMTGMDIADHRRPQDGRVSMVANGQPVDIRAASLPTIYGEALVLRILQRDQGLLEIDKVGFAPEALRRYQRSYQRAWGMVLVTGPTGSGKTTTLYASVNELNDPSQNTITVEDPIEYRVAGIKQTQVNEKVGYTFAAGLRAALRSDPDTILIGEIRDLETARISAESALTGHLVLSTLHANDAASSTTRLIEMGLEPYLVTSSLECVVAQRLLRRLCDRCRIATPASPEERLELVSMALIDESAPEVLLYRAVGCAHCDHRGYLGRMAVHEVLVMDDPLKSLVLQRAPANEIARVASAGGMVTLLQDAFAKMLTGQTSFEECKRVLR